MLGKHLVFLDSFQFMSSSLDRLSANLPKDKFKYTSEVFKKEKLELMTQKGVHPYDYMDSFERFNETQLPSKDDFFSQLTQDAITDEQYCHATKVWGTFNLLLADVFENFRSPFAVLQLRPMSLLYITRIELGCSVKNDRHKIGVND